jgi:hypothetical protein
MNMMPPLVDCLKLSLEMRILRKSHPVARNLEYQRLAFTEDDSSGPEPDLEFDDLSRLYTFLGTMIVNRPMKLGQIFV